MNPNAQFRYPGLTSFTTAQQDIFYGRKRETRELFHLLSVEKTVVLFSKSGLGKTSLLNAGVLPLLAGSHVVPVPIRFGNDSLLPEAHFAVQLEAAHQLFSGEKAPKAEHAETFWQHLKNRPFERDGERRTPLLIFDQFEELFTLYPQPERRARFVQELADLIQERLPERLRESLFEQLDAGQIHPSAIAEAEKAPPVKFVFSIRSDMLHFMDELSEQIPYILRSRYQLFGLAGEQAREAIVAPAALPNVRPGDRGDGCFASPSFEYTEAALQEIIGTLTKNREVESFQLQVVCQALEEKIIAGYNHADPHIKLPLITPAFYGGAEGIARILEESYQRRLETLDAASRQPAALLLEDALVNENGRRRSVDVAELLMRPGVTPALLNALEAQRLVRKEPRLESFYYEISHDTLLGPIVKSRKAREAEEEKARAAAELAEERRKRARTRRALALSMALSGVAVTAGVFAFLQKQKADVATLEANEKRVEAENQRNAANAALQQIINARKEKIQNQIKLDEEAQFHTSVARNREKLAKADSLERASAPLDRILNELEK